MHSYEEFSKLSVKSNYTKVELSKITRDHIGKSITTFGWVQTVRTQGKMTFFDLYAGFKTIKCVSKKREGDKSLTQWTSLTVSGEVNENMNPGRDNHEFELSVNDYCVHSYAPSFPINAESSPFTLLELGHLALRTPERGFFLRARSRLMRIIRNFFFEKECVEVTPPTLVQTQVEGGSTLFKFDYYEKDAYLTQSSQLYLETVVPVCQKAFCVLPSYRAEKSNTARHLSEYTHVEGELADIDFDGLLSFCEEMIIYAMKQFYGEMESDILSVYPGFTFHEVPEKITRLDYVDAIAYLNSIDELKADGTKYEVGDDIPDSAERLLCEKFGGPIFLTRFLAEHKAFYAKKETVAPEFTQSVDLLFPGVGEILGGSMRCDDYDELIAGFEREGIDTAPYYWYTDLRKYGTFSHGGFGLGFERFMMGLMRWKSVNMACLYPRFVRRCTP